MKAPALTLEQEPQKAFEGYFNWLKADIYGWYKRASGRAYYGWLITSWLAVLAGFSTTVVGILIENQILAGPLVKSVPLILPAVGSLAALLLPRFIENKALRERGRQRAQTMLTEAQRAYASLNDADLAQFHNELIERVDALEEEQLRGFLHTAQKQLGEGEPTNQSDKPTPSRTDGPVD